MSGEISQDLIAKLGLRMEDEDGTTFPKATKYTFFNKAQKTLCNLIHPDYLTELETTESDLDVTTSGRIVTIASAPTDGGTGYTLNDVLTVTTGNGDATVQATGVTAGVVDEVTLVLDGTGGYSVASGQATSGGDGTGCTINVTAVSSSENSYEMAYLNSTLGVLGGAEGIKGIQVDIGGAGTSVIWSVRIPMSDVKKMENSLLAYDDDDPRHYMFENKIYPLMTTYASTTMDVYFLKMPTTMSDSVDPIINKALHGALLSLAEAMLWQADGKKDRFDVANGLATQEINILNSRIKPYKERS